MKLSKAQKRALETLRDHGTLKWCTTYGAFRLKHSKWSTVEHPIYKNTFEVLRRLRLAVYDDIGYSIKITDAGRELINEV